MPVVMKKWIALISSFLSLGIMSRDVLTPGPKRPKLKRFLPNSDCNLQTQQKKIRSHNPGINVLFCTKELIMGEWFGPKHKGCSGFNCIIYLVQTQTLAGEGTWQKDCFCQTVPNRIWRSMSPEATFFEEHFVRLQKWRFSLPVSHAWSYSTQGPRTSPLSLDRGHS